MRIVAAGGSIAGLTCALVLARAGHELLVLERDDVVPAADADAALAAARPGVAHYHQPHAFIPRGRREMLALLPDVYARLLAVGGLETDVGRKLRGERRPEDEELRYLWVRRPVLEWVLREKAAREQGISLRSGAKVSGLLLAPGEPPRVTGLRLASGEEISADLVLDALGRTSPVPAWLESAGASIPDQSEPSHLVYYSRYFRLRPEGSIPDGPWFTAPRGNLGYAAFSIFPGDNATFAVLIAVPAWDHALRQIRDDQAFLAVCRAVPLLAGLMAQSEPIAPVQAMGGLPNTLRHYAPDGKALVRGLLAVGDALAYTDPTFALGLSALLMEAGAIRTLLASGSERLEERYYARVMPELEERYQYAVAVGDARARSWRGERLDFARASGSYPLFVFAGAGAVATSDDDVLRKVARHAGFLDRTAVFDEDTALHARIEGLLNELLSGASPPRSGPTRDELLALLRQPA